MFDAHLESREEPLVKFTSWLDTDGVDNVMWYTEEEQQHRVLYCRHERWQDK